uniref:Uncharacterized protein n=1 Tax=Chromera velia CCMP2878 TaxID=1169474 RepID=A0A0G4HM25_9ALVE|mmetsp:Transcript_54827/g.107268  ORF Transcript_54827/g.107268 Transcript_54827/m.107268 type:complete len:524 (+) Transcript_54827:194-1765(+)|eukprot:Cvel_1160.t1-p1 / transcript=Cvel_1160.t1 / gene=Cvel_1160 / organism=Chromera_velia_CCMP2878 / gene_product=Tetratricopeptide repeat protein 1, putative / transcript_product=Tetratricopeptide repeat protein 1, putative / location=Cvel_scaffold38:109665-113506(+) / protein_length=523 / sequence_SO=supercontig / SO=protein_coding / is_pseudo=false
MIAVLFSLGFLLVLVATAVQEVKRVGLKKCVASLLDFFFAGRLWTASPSTRSEEAKGSEPNEKEEDPSLSPEDQKDRGTSEKVGEGEEESPLTSNLECLLSETRGQTIEDEEVNKDEKGETDRDEQPHSASVPEAVSTRRAAPSDGVEEGMKGAEGVERKGEESSQSLDRETGNLGRGLGEEGSGNGGEGPQVLEREREREVPVPVQSEEENVETGREGEKGGSMGSKGLGEETKIEEIQEVTVKAGGEGEAEKDGEEKEKEKKEGEDEEDDEDELSADRAKTCKEKGNEHFRQGEWEAALRYYTEGIAVCPEEEEEGKLLAILYGNRAACHMNLNQTDFALKDCSDALYFNPTYTKVLTRRASIYEQKEKWHDALEDLKKAIEADSQLQRPLSQQLKRVEKKSQEQFEKEKEEVVGKLKDMGNWVLGNFGLSLDNFKVEQNDNGSYNIQFQQNPGQSNPTDSATGGGGAGGSSTRVTTQPVSSADPLGSRHATKGPAAPTSTSQTMLEEVTSDTDSDASVET